MWVGLKQWKDVWMDVGWVRYAFRPIRSFQHGCNKMQKDPYQFCKSGTKDSNTRSFQVQFLTISSSHDSISTLSIHDVFLSPSASISADRTPKHKDRTYPEFTGFWSYSSWDDGLQRSNDIMGTRMEGSDIDIVEERGSEAESDNIFVMLEI